MLKGKKGKQQDIDQPDVGSPGLVAFVDGFGNIQVIYKSHGIQKSYEKYYVTNDPIKEKYKPFQNSLLCIWLIKMF